MKHIVRTALNALPRPLLQRAAKVCVPVAGLFYAGRGRECPICGARRRRFLPYGYVEVRDDALCPRCLSLERHRALWLCLQEEPAMTDTRNTLLHIAPEPCLKSRFERMYAAAGAPERYITADLESPWATLHFDVQQIPLADESIDAVICNHLLEHVDDDRRALAELYRIMRPGGWGILLAPVDMARGHTFEDASATTPEQRTALFGQYDHRRIYGRDYPQRLRGAGFEVEERDMAAELSPEQRKLFAIRSDEHIYIVHKRAQNDR